MTADTHEYKERARKLAARAVECKHWRWMPGMMTANGERVLEVWPPFCAAPGFLEVYPERPGTRDPLCSDEVPDLDDPATLGCLLALVREAWDGQQACAAYQRGVWYIDEAPQHAWCSEAEALVNALESAP